MARKLTVLRSIGLIEQRLHPGADRRSRFRQPQQPHPLPTTVARLFRRHGWPECAGVRDDCQPAGGRGDCGPESSFPIMTLSSAPSTIPATSFCLVR